MSNQNEEGQIRRPPDSPKKKHRFGPNHKPNDSHAGRKGLYGAPRDSEGYSQRWPQQEAGYGGESKPVSGDNKPSED